MRIVFMGTPEIAVPSLERLISDGHDLCAVVTQPDRPKGRGKKLAFSPVKEAAMRHELEILQPEKASQPDFLDRLRELNPDLIVVIAFGQILRKEVLDLPKYGCVNVHVSLLPKYRGAAPINWAIINGEEKTGVTTMFMDEGLDTGDIIKTREFRLDDEINAGQLHDIMMEEGADVLSQTVKAIEDGTAERIRQNDDESTYAPMMDRNLGHIDFKKSAVSIHNLVRGTVPWPGAWCESPYGKIKIWKTRIGQGQTDREPGTIVSVGKQGIEVACGMGMLLIEEIQMPNKKRMHVSEYIKGNTIEIGKVLT
ncbi:methionyl-tRNA formyltransferase [uncultured Peptostreptococcus sp.]|nr:methionyl-tRNA formyltransferase [uncultured Peptostreptococcus sp.]